MENNYNLYDKELRKKIIKDPKATLAKLNAEFTDNIQIVVKKNSKNTLYFVMPDKTMSNLDTTDINAAGRHVGTIGTGGTIGLVTTVASAGSR